MAIKVVMLARVMALSGDFDGALRTARSLKVDATASDPFWNAHAEIAYGLALRGDLAAAIRYAKSLETPELKRRALGRAATGYHDRQRILDPPKP